jgi:hypothetical protein
VNLTAVLDETNTGLSNIGGANYTVGIQTWGTSVDMNPTNGAWDEIVEDANKTINISTWPASIYQICVYGWDSAVPQNNNVTGSCSQLTIIPPADLPPTLEVWAPGDAPGESYIQGALIDIRWNATDDNPPLPPNPINISYGLGNPSPWIPIANDVIDNGLYQWDTALVACPRVYWVNISVYDSIGQTVFAESNESFSIYCPGDSPPVIAVYEPGATSGQTHVQGDTIEITWFADDDNSLPATPINITYRNITSGLIPISNNESDDGTFDWVTSAVICPDTYWVNISVHDSIGQKTFGESNYSFDIICPIGDITGIIVDENGDPIQGATVTLRNSTGAVLATTTTPLDGSFIFVNVTQAVSEYNVSAAKANYVTNTVVDIDVTAGSTTDLGNVVLQTDALITGRIVKPDGSPISGATIELIDDGGSTISTTTSDAAGAFTFTGVAYGDYSVKASAAGYLNNTTAIFSVDSNNLVIPLGNIELGNFGNITGKVVDENGDPIEGAAVTLTNSTGATIGTTTTDANGDFTFMNVTKGAVEYEIGIEKEFYVDTGVDGISVTAGQTENVGTITLDTNAVISGDVVREDGSEIVGAQVELLDENGNPISTRNTDTNGEYEFTGIGYGTYSLRFSFEGFETNTTKQFTVEAGNLDITKNGELSVIEPTEPMGETQDWWWILLIVVVIIVVVLLLLFFLIRRKREPTEQAPPAAGTPTQPEEPPAEGGTQTQEAQPQAGQKVCSNCGSTLDPEYIICPYCGRET